MVEWRGSRIDQQQALEWPRQGVDRDGLPFNGTPGPIVDSEVMLCAAAGDAPLLGSTGGNDPNRQVVRETADDAAVEFERPRGRGRRYPLVIALISPWCFGASFSGFAQIQAARG
jgi:hypothetical protein